MCLCLAIKYFRTWLWCICVSRWLALRSVPRNFTLLSDFGSRWLAGLDLVPASSFLVLMYFLVKFEQSSSSSSSSSLRVYLEYPPFVFVCRYTYLNKVTATMTINCTTIDHRTSLPFPLHCGESLNQGLHREDVAKWFVATSSHGCLQLVDLLFSIWVGPFTSALCHCPDDWYCQRYGWSTSLVLEVWLHICPIWSIFWFAFWQCYKSCA